MTRFVITGTGSSVPPRRVSNAALSEKMDTSDEWIRSHTGIAARHMADESCATSDLAVEAARAALEKASPGAPLAEAARAVDVIVVATATPDYQGCPSTACLVQHALGAVNAAALDLAAGCTGFVYGLETAAGLLAVGPGRARALVIGAETLTRFLDWGDRSVSVLFGDGAGAVVLDKVSAAEDGRAASPRGLLRSLLRADGSGAQDLIFRRGGSRAPFRAGETLEKGMHLSMNGRAVYTFAVKALCETIEALLAAERLSHERLAWIVPHQANARIVQAAAKRLGIPEEKFFLNIADYANTSAASIPLALDELNRSGRLHPGDLILSAGFGAGLTYGGNLIEW
ncbi:MAG: ketoacyl-ACP synthase III [Treponema sp.]|nr:ketoacyl-ACP synthase III [Treponema sp.]